MDIKKVSDYKLGRMVCEELKIGWQPRGNMLTELALYLPIPLFIKG